MPRLRGILLCQRRGSTGEVVQYIVTTQRLPTTDHAGYSIPALLIVVGDYDLRMRRVLCESDVEEEQGMYLVLGLQDVLHGQYGEMTVEQLLKAVLHPSPQIAGDELRIDIPAAQIVDVDIYGRVVSESNTESILGRKTSVEGHCHTSISRRIRAEQ